VQHDSGADRAQHRPPSHPPDFGAVTTPARPTPPTSNTKPMTFVNMIDLQFKIQGMVAPTSETMFALGARD
jgi:hypothetical protein